MAQQTSFDLDDAKSLQTQLNSFSGIFQGEWDHVLNQWAKLKSSWNDEQFNQFEPFFERLTITYEKSVRECNEYEYFLAEQIKIIEEKKSKLGDLVTDTRKKAVATVQIGAALVAMVTNPKAQIDVNQQVNKLYSYQNKLQSETREKDIDINSVSKKFTSASGSPDPPKLSE